MNIRLGCDVKDIEFISNVEKYFGKDKVTKISRKGHIGLEEISLIISVASLSIEFIQFIQDNMATKNEKSELSNKRVLITKNGDEVLLIGYSGEDIERIIRSIFNDN